LLYNKGFDVKNSAMDAFGAPVEDMPYLLDIIEKVVKQTEIEYSRYLFDNNIGENTKLNIKSIDAEKTPTEMDCEVVV
jgi:hypothetical protein